MNRSKLNSISKTDILDIIASDKNEDNMSQPDSTQDTLQIILREIRSIKVEQEKTTKALEDVSKLRTEVETLKAKVNTQSMVFEKQQLFLEKLDARDRIQNLIISGVSEERQIEGSSTDDQKIALIFEKLECDDIQDYTSERLGSSTEGRTRPIKIQVQSQAVRDQIVSRSKRLKEAGEPFNRIYIKKDTHPMVRKEWKRLFQAKDAESDKPENVGKEVRIDMKTRTLRIDDVVVDRWKPTFF